MRKSGSQGCSLVMKARERCCEIKPGVSCMIRRVIAWPCRFSDAGDRRNSRCRLFICPRASPRAGPADSAPGFLHLPGRIGALCAGQQCAYLRPECRLRRSGEYLRDRRHYGLRPSRDDECLPTDPGAKQHDVGVRGEIQPCWAHCSGAPTWVATIKAWASGWPPCRTAA